MIFKHRKNTGRTGIAAMMRKPQSADVMKDEEVIFR
jgi:hypothetical protein